MAKTVDESEINKIKEIITKYEDFINPVEVCTKCKGKGKKSIYNNRDFVCEINCKFCQMGNINPLKRYNDEKLENIKQRLIKNFSLPLNRVIKEDLIKLISLFNDGKSQVPKELNDKLDVERTKYFIYSTNRFIENLWNDSKNKKIENLIQIFIKYLLMPPTTPQLRNIRLTTGISKNWYRLSMDYYECYEIIGEVERELDRNKKKLKRYGKLDDDEKNKFLSEVKIPHPYPTTTRDDILRIRFTKQLAWCIEHDPRKYSFDENEISSLNRHSKMILFLELKDNESEHVKKFLDEWKRSMEEQMGDIYEMDKKLFENLFSKIKDKKEPINIIEKIYDKNKNQFKQNEDEDGEIYDYKSSTFATKSLIEKHEGILKQKRPNKDTNYIKRFAIKFADDEVINKIRITIVAFLNTGNGTIIIGVDDNGILKGIEILKDAYNIRNTQKSTDQQFPDVYRRYIQEILEKVEQPDIRKHYSNSHIKVDLTKIGGKYIVMITVKKSNYFCYYTSYDKFVPQKSKTHYYKRKNGKNFELTGSDLEDEFNSRN